VVAADFDEDGWPDIYEVTPRGSSVSAPDVRRSALAVAQECSAVAGAFMKLNQGLEQHLNVT
jgi:hypothetical protein